MFSLGFGLLKLKIFFNEGLCFGVDFFFRTVKLILHLGEIGLFLSQRSVKVFNLGLKFFHPFTKWLIVVFKLNDNLVFVFFGLEDFQLGLFQIFLGLFEFFFKVFDNLDHFLVWFMELTFLIFFLLNWVIEFIDFFHEPELALTGLEVLFFFLLLIEWQVGLEIGKFFFKKLLSLGKTLFSAFYLLRMFFHQFLNVLIVLSFHLLFGQENLFELFDQLRNFDIELLFCFLLLLFYSHSELDILCDRFLQFWTCFSSLLFKLENLLLVGLIVFEQLVCVRLNLLLWRYQGVLPGRLILV